MTKIEVTDAMVERFIDAHDQTDDSAFKGARRKREIRRGLEAALNQPAEPEMPVTEEMLVAGLQASIETMSFVGLTQTQVGAFRPTVSRWAAQRVYRAMAAKAPKPEWFVRSSSWNCLKCGDSNIFDIKRHVCPAKAPSTDCANTPVWAESVAVGQPLGRTDGLVALHLGGSVAFLNQKECDRLRDDLINACHRARYPSDEGHAIADDIARRVTP